MINLKNVYFGCADASTEAERNPAVFKRVFFDPHNHMDELIYGDKFILRGRKGDGKTAFGAQLSLIAQEKNIYVYQRSLNSFNNEIFAKIKVGNRIGGNQYISFWKCILMIECVRMIHKYEPNIQTCEFVDIVDVLIQNNFLVSDNDISMTVKNLVEINSDITIKNFFATNRKYNYQKELRGADDIYNAIKESIRNIYLDHKFIFVIDGLDDILYNSEFRSEIITGLIRAAEEINNIFRKTTLKIKILILVRDDIFFLCRDPNFSKIRRDSSIGLSWSVYADSIDSDLFDLVYRRFAEEDISKTNFIEVWNELFPTYIGNTDSLSYVLDNIIYRPRDILQFFIEVQKEFVCGKKLTESHVQRALARYSEDYFIEAMRDELTGFFSNEVVTRLPDILSKMGTRYFYLSQFEKECAVYPEFENISCSEILEKLFAAGYIGQHRPREDRDFTVFSYRNLRETFQKEHECILHRGLTRALTI